MGIWWFLGSLYPLYPLFVQGHVGVYVHCVILKCKRSDAKRKFSRVSLEMRCMFEALCNPDFSSDLRC